MIGVILRRWRPLLLVVTLLIIAAFVLAHPRMIAGWLVLALVWLATWGAP